MNPAAPMAVRSVQVCMHWSRRALAKRKMALRYLHKAAAADLELDPNSAGGIRIAGLGAVWQAVVLGFAGLDLPARRWRSKRNRAYPQPVAKPVIPGALEGPVGRDRIAGGTVRVAMSDGEAVDIRIAGGTHRLQAGSCVGSARHACRSRFGLAAASDDCGMFPKTSMSRQQLVAIVASMA